MQWALTIALPTIGAYVGSRITIAKMEVHVENNTRDIAELKDTVREHEGTLNSHSIQLAVMDGPRNLR